MRALLLLLIGALGACGGKHAVRVDCEGELVPVNVPAADSTDVPAETKRAAEQ
jgi:hypothetical protein